MTRSSRSFHSRLFDRRSFHPSCIRWIHSVILSGWQDGRWIGWLGGRHQPPHAELAFGHLCMSQELLEQQQRPVLWSWCWLHPITPRSSWLVLVIIWLAGGSPSSPSLPLVERWLLPPTEVGMAHCIRLLVPGLTCVVVAYPHVCMYVCAHLLSRLVRLRRTRGCATRHHVSGVMCHSLDPTFYCRAKSVIMCVRTFLIKMCVRERFRG